MSLSRRALVISATAALGGCGFHPLYLPGSAGGGGAPADMAAIYIPPIPERTGQLVRQALQDRMEPAGPGVAKRYELTVTPAISVEGIGIQADSSTSRFRVFGRGPWVLQALDVKRTALANGTSRVVDGFNIIDQQYFAADQEQEAAFRRIAESLADQIVQQVAVYLRRHPADTGIGAAESHSVTPYTAPAAGEPTGPALTPGSSLPPGEEPIRNGL